MFNIKGVVCLILWGVLLTGCKTLKNKKDVDYTKTDIVETKRAGDTLSYVVPNVKYRDTTIYIKNFEKQGSNTIRIAYDEQGTQQIDCISDEIRELTKSIVSLQDNSKTKETEFKDINFLYIFLGLVCLLFVNKLANKFM